MDYKIGLDLGISSVGWAVIQTDCDGNPVKIENLGSRIFDKAENPKDGSSLALKRREARGVRRRLRRRRHRRDRVLSLLEEYNIISKKEVQAMFSNSEYRFEKNVYELRVEGLDTLLTAKELARVLINFVKRRGYKSNSISEEKSDKDIGKLLTATVENDKIMKENDYKTVAQMYLNDERFTTNKNFNDGRKILKIRNTTDSYTSTVRRSDLVNEIKLILQKQKELNSKITDKFIEKYLNIFESQRSFEEGPGGDSPYGGNQIEKMIGRCTLEPREPRAVKASYTFEYFKLLQDINHIKLECKENIDGKVKNISKSLSNEQRKELINLAKKSDTISFDKIRKVLNLDYNVTFNMVNYNLKKVSNIEDLFSLSEKETKLREFQSYHKIRKILDKIEKGIVDKLSIDTLNKLAYALSVFKNDKSIKKYLKENCRELTDELIENLLEISFSKVGNLSIKAMEKLIPFLEQGLTYDKAVEKVYGKDVNINVKRKNKLSFNTIKDDITNPVVKRAVSQTIKVVNAIVNKYGEPLCINIELARELSKTFEERNRISKKNEERKSENEKAKLEIQEMGKFNVTGQDIIKYRLWKEQDEICIYSGHKITPDELFTELVDIDHIIPYSISFDDTFNNKVLVLSSENRKKGNRVPIEYLRKNGMHVDEYKLRIETTYIKKNNYKKLKKLLVEGITREDIDNFKERNIKDTQYLSRLMYNLLRNNLKFKKNDGIKIKVQAVNGAITSHIRKRLGIEKIRANGDKHHAIDAVIIAIITPKLIQSITNFYKYNELKNCNIKENKIINEETGEYVDLSKFPQPYQGFREELEIRSLQNENLMHEALKNSKLVRYTDIENVKPIFVSRMPRRKVTGAAHKDTIRGLRKHDNNFYSVTKTPLTKLSLTKDEMDIDGYSEKQKIDDIYLYKALLKRLKEFDGNAKEAFKDSFYKPNKDGSKGAIVKKVKIEKKVSSFVTLNDGKSLAENGSMVRIDVFYIENEGYYLVPVYTKNVIEKNLPNKASIAKKPESEWKEMNDKDFIFSLYPNDLVHIKSKKPIEFIPSENQKLENKLYNDVFAYYVSSDISSASIEIKTHDNEYKRRGLGIKTLLEIKKYEVDVLGEYHEVRIPEKRNDFKNVKGGKKA